MRPRHLAAFIGAALLTGFAVAVPAVPARAQPSPALEELFVELRQLQDANIGIARQMSEIQRQAAAVLEAAQAEAGTGDPAQQQVLGALVANALTLASVVLAPVATQEVAAGDAFAALLERNLAFVAMAQPLFADHPLADAVAQYAVMQVQTQDLGLALRNGWNRYGEAVATAEAAGLLPAGSFDLAGRSWTLTLPDLEIAAAQPSADAERLAPDNSALDTEIFAAAPDANVAAALAREAERLANVAPGTALAVPTLDDQNTGELAYAESPGGEGGGTDAAASSIVAPNQPASWMVMIGDNARAVAMAVNSNAATAGRIRNIQIGCHPNGTLRYVFEAEGDVGEYLVFANPTQGATIRADGNVVSGGEAIHMSDVLRLAFESATADGASDGRLMIAPADAPDDVATFPASGYLEARGRVLDGCVPWVDETAPEADAPTAAPAGIEGEMVVEPELAPPAADGGGGAPIPQPRPANRMPVDLMGAG